jgi:riboflavin biosynthesis pyrimidine reductase
MVSTVDGATALDGASSGLGSPGDRRVFSALRSVPDMILVAAGTVRREGYGPVQLAEERQQQRRARGQEPVPKLAIVSRSLDLDLDSPLFRESAPPPIVITTADAPLARRAEIADRADLVLAGQGGSVDLQETARAMAELGARIVLCEGGPSLNGQLVSAELVDEVCLSLAPSLASGSSARIAHGAPLATLAHLRLRHVLEEDGFLFLRYTR